MKHPPDWTCDITVASPGEGLHMSREQRRAVPRTNHMGQFDVCFRGQKTQSNCQHRCAVSRLQRPHRSVRGAFHADQRAPAWIPGEGSLLQEGGLTGSGQTGSLHRKVHLAGDLFRYRWPNPDLVPRPGWICRGSSAAVWTWQPWTR